MLRLTPFRKQLKSLGDLLPYAFVVDEGIIVNKSGSLTASFEYRGQDLDLADSEELNQVQLILANTLVKYGSGWEFRVDCISYETDGYIDALDSFFPDATSFMIDEERRLRYNQQNLHYEKAYFITLTFMPPTDADIKLGAFFTDKKGNSSIYSAHLKRFKKDINDFVDNLETILRIRQLSSQEQISFIISCMLGTHDYVEFPDTKVYLDYILGRMADLVTGKLPKIGDRYFKVVSIVEYPGYSYPGILDCLNKLRIAYRWNTRFIRLDTRDADYLLKKIRKVWAQKRRSLLGFLREASGKEEGVGWQNDDVMVLASMANEAVMVNNLNTESYGFYTSTVVLFNEDINQLNNDVRLVRKAIENIGFKTMLEDINAVEAYLGSLPAIDYANVRLPILSVNNIADLIPTTSIWSGLERNPSQLFVDLKINNPPLMYTVTDGATPFRVSLHINDVGHTIVLGPSGAGKSTLLNLIAAQHLRYKNAKVFYFDMDYSSQALCYGVGGNHYDIGNFEAKISFQPLRNVDTTEERDIAYAFIKVLCELKLPRLDEKRESKLTPEQTSILIDTIKLFSKYGKEERTLWEFYNQINAKDQYLAEAIKYFTHEGPFQNLFESNNEEYDMVNVPICTYELKALYLKYGNEALIPLLVYLFTNLKFKLFPLRYPLLFIFDEAWAALNNGVFKGYLNDLIRTERKNNVIVVLASHQINDIPKDIYGQCPTRIFLPNPAACELESDYRSLGLNLRQIQVLSSAKPRKQYYYTSPYGRRVFELDICELTKCFVGVNDPVNARKLYHKHNKEFSYYWIRELAQKYNSSTLLEWADYWLKINKKMNSSLKEFNNGEY
ncbi:MAG: hypothetical protein KBD37_00260 [Burkholderiales bacterium]|nr:hypothetical protein [Burkholderiales bacterium]